MAVRTYKVKSKPVLGPGAGLVYTASTTILVVVLLHWLRALPGLSVYLSAASTYCTA